MGGGNTKQHTVLNDTTAQVKLLEGSTNNLLQVEPRLYTVANHLYSPS